MKRVHSIVRWAEYAAVTAVFAAFLYCYCTRDEWAPDASECVAESECVAGAESAKPRQPNDGPSPAGASQTQPQPHALPQPHGQPAPSALDNLPDIPLVEPDSVLPIPQPPSAEIVPANAESLAPEPPPLLPTDQPRLMPPEPPSPVLRSAPLAPADEPRVAPVPPPIQRPPIPRDPEPPDNSKFFTPITDLPPEERALYQTPVDPPLGFTGRSGIAPRDVQEDPHFVPVEDRLRIGFPEWDRYGRGHPPVNACPYVLGRWIDPYIPNVLKGDFPILGQNVFLEVTATSRTLIEARQTPIATTPFESTARPFQEQFFGRPTQ